MTARIIGPFSSQPNIGHDQFYFEQRDMTLDCREPDMIRLHPSAVFSVGDKILTLSHRAREMGNGTLVKKPVVVERDAWIGAFVILTGTTIGEHSIVSIGSVVANRDVPPFVICEGNPAQIVARWNGSDWVSCSPEPLPRHSHDNG